NNSGLIEPNKFLIWSAFTADKGMLAIQPYFIDEKSIGKYDKDGNYISYRNLNRYRLYGLLRIYYGVTDNIELSIHPVYEKRFTNSNLYQNEPSGIGDLPVMLRYALLRRDVRVTLSSTFSFPVGKKGISYGYFWGEYGASAVFPVVDKVYFHTNILYKIISPKHGLPNDFGDAIKYAFALEYVEGENGFSGMLAIRQFLRSETAEFDGKEIEDSDNSLLEISPSIGYNLANYNLGLRAGYSAPINGRNYSRAPAFYISATWRLGHFLGR
ncbi:MAG: hypothetical protein NTW04_03555, partial [Elusimicrobia bacterium]|nr:hypothetical protein [Elusimicrobiota bacterium]